MKVEIIPADTVDRDAAMNWFLPLHAGCSFSSGLCSCSGGVAVADRAISVDDLCCKEYCARNAAVGEVRVPANERIDKRLVDFMLLECALRVLM